MQEKEHIEIKLRFIDDLSRNLSIHRKTDCIRQILFHFIWKIYVAMWL